MYPRSVQKKWRQRQVKLPVQLVYPERIVRQVAAAKCELMALSEGNAIIHIGTLTRIPDYFYLQFDFDDAELIGCFVVGRDAGIIHCNFLRVIDANTVERIVARSEIGSLLDSFWSETEASG